MKIPITILLALYFTSVFSQEMVDQLRGFQIGQYRNAVKNELGNPFKKDKYDDGFEYEIYLVRPDTSAYMIFEYSPANLEEIWSIQLTGRGYETDFKNLNLGDENTEVLKKLGTPSTKVDAGTYGERWEYERTNYSVEINKKGKLSSIKIKDDSHKLFPKVAVDKIHSFDFIKAALQSKDRAKVKELLCPDIEITFNNSVYSFRRSIQNEINEDVSGLFKLISQLIKDLDKIDSKNKDEYEENLRFIPNQESLYVIKIKKGSIIKEIVLQYRFGKYLIWEIKT